MRYSIGAHKFDTNRRELLCKGVLIQIEPQVFDLLEFLVRHRDRVVSREEIFESVWDGRIVSDVNLSSRINALRSALGDDGKKQKIIKTIHGRGFRFVADASELDEPIEEPQHAHRILTKFAWPALVAVAFIAAWIAYDQLADGGGTVTGKPGIAVLPFENLSGDPGQDYFADGMTEDIITDLSNFGLFFVISRNSSFAYKGVSVDIKDVARELGVQYILEGSVRKSGDRLRITAQFIDALADKHIWAERYDRELEDVFQVQDEITQSIVASVAPEYLSAELQRAQRMEARNLDAWDAFMRGYWHLLRFTKDDNANAQRFLRKAIDLEPNRANSHGVLAVTHLMDGFYGWSESKEVSFREALESAERGLALDSQDSQALRAIGLVHFFSKNHDVALSYYEQAVAANPNEAENRALLGAALGVAGDYDAALEQFETAFRLSPRDIHNATWYGYLAVAAFVVGQDEEAADWARKAVERNPQFPSGHRTLAASAGNLGQLTEAATAREKLQKLQPHLTIAQLRESLPYFKNIDDLKRYLDGLRKAGLPEGTTK